jgi:thioredoxin-related protein
MKLILSSIALCALSAPVLADGAKWYADFDEAAKVAAEQNKNLLVDFTGSDWCGWCIRLHEEVFDHEAFEKGVADNFILVALDFPKAAEVKAKVPNPERNAELKGKYGITGFPTVLLMTPKGEVFGRTGYQAGGPEAYVSSLNGMLKTGLVELRELQRLVAEFDAAEGEARTKLLAGLLDRLEGLGEDSPFVSILLGPARVALAEGSDAQQQRALKALIGAGAVDGEVLAVAKKIDPKNEKGLWFEALLGMVTGVTTEEGVLLTLVEMDAFLAGGPAVAGEEGLRFYFYGAFWNQRFAKNEAKAKDYAKLALPLCDDEQMKAMLDEILEG